MADPMQDNVVIVWDVETVSDIDAARRMLDMERASEDDVREH
jgi:hypothetical protein